MARYYISTGQKSGFYTLRVEFAEPTYYKSEYGVVSAGMVARDHYIMTLTRDPQTALAKAQKYLADVGAEGTLEAPDFDLFDIRRHAHDAEWGLTFHGGKYEGRSIEWVLQNDPEYALWAAQNMGGPKYAQTVEILQEYLAPQLEALAAERVHAAQTREQALAQARAILAPLAERMADGQGGFRDSIAREMLQGVIPRGRGLTITLDILAKQMGRGNSKAYWDEYEKLQDLLDPEE